MYTQADLNQIILQLKKRWRIAILPAAILICLGIALFVYGQITRIEFLWKVTTALTILGGFLFLFLYGVWVRPLSLYQKHVKYMLFGKKRHTTGWFTSFSADLSDREGLDCYAVMINIGDTNDPMDDRLFYYDAHKPKPTIALGEKVLVESNDKMIANFQKA